MYNGVVITSDPVCELVRRSREEQGLPPTICDPGTLARVAELITLAGFTPKNTSVNAVVRPLIAARRRAEAGAASGQ